MIPSLYRGGKLPKYRTKISRNDRLKEGLYWYVPKAEANKSVHKLPAIRDILEDVSRYGNVSQNYDEYYIFVQTWHPGFPMADEDHEEALKGSKRYKKIFSDEDIRVIAKVCPPSVWINLERREMDCTRKLRGEGEYYARLASKLGFDIETGELNTKSFPITKEDKQMGQIKNQILDYNSSVTKYNQYLRYLLKKYRVGPRCNWRFYHYPVTKQDPLKFDLDI